MNRTFNETYLDPRRLCLCAKKDLFSTKKQFILVPATITAFLVMIGLITPAGGGSLSNDDYLRFFTLILYTGGLLTTSSVFKDRHSREGIHNWLMLPASTLEKFLVRFLFSTIGVAAGTIIIVWFSSLLISIGNSMIHGFAIKLFNPLDFIVWQSIQGYLPLQALFFLGASWFRKHPLLKTLLTLFIIQILISIIGGGLGYMILFRYLKDNMVMETQLLYGSGLSARSMIIALRVLFQGIIPLACWTAAYFRLKEAEVKDGV